MALSDVPQSGGRNAVAVDTHAHVFGRGYPLAPHRRYEPEGEATIGEYLGLLDVHGVSHAVLVQPSFFGTDNACLVAALRTAPHRLRGIAVVDALATDAELDRLAAVGVVGIRLNLLHPRPPLDLAGPAWQHLLGRIAERGWLVEVQADEEDLARVLAAVGATGPRIVVDHFGRVGSADPARGGLRALLDAAAGGRVWIKLSAPYRFAADAGRVAAVLLADPGPERLLWGSDWPWTGHSRQLSYARTLQWLEEWVASPAPRRIILGATPAGLFGFT